MSTAPREGQVAATSVGIYPKFAPNFAGLIRNEVGQAGTAAGTAFGKNLNAAAIDKVKGEGIGTAAVKVLDGVLSVAASKQVAQFVNGVLGDWEKLQGATRSAADTFGASMVKIDAAARDGVSSMGLSRRQVIESTDGFALYAHQAGLAGDAAADFSLGLTQAAAGLSLWKGASVDRTMNAVLDALSGSVAKLGEYGIRLDDATLKQRAMQMGLTDGTRALTDQEKVLAIQAEILAQSAHTQRVFTDGQADSVVQARQLAAESANLSAELGQKLQPALIAAQKAGLSFLQWAQDNQGILTPLAGGFALVTAGALGLVAAAKAFEAARTVKEILDGIGTALSNMSTRAKVATASAGALGIALAVISTAYEHFVDQQDRAEETANDYAAALRGQTKAINEGTLAVAARKLQEQGAFALANEFGIGLDVVTQAALGNADALKQVTTATEAANRAAQERAATEGGAQVIATREHTRQLLELLGIQNTIFQNTVTKDREMAEATGAVATGVRSVKVEVKGYLTQVYAVAEAYRRIIGSSVDFEEALDETTAAVKRNGKGLSDRNEVGRANLRALDALAEQARKHSIAMQDEGKSAADVNVAMDRARAVFIAAAIAAGASTTEAAKMANEYGVLSSQSSTTATNQKAAREAFMEAAEQAGIGAKKARELWQELSKIPAKVDTTWSLGLPSNKELARFAKRIHDQLQSLVNSNPLRVPVISSGAPIARAHGGPVPGVAYHDRDDKVPVLATPDEWLIQRPTTRYYGDEIMAKINAGYYRREDLQRLAFGGRVAGKPIAASQTTAPGQINTAELAAAIAEALDGAMLRIGPMEVLADTVAGRIMLAVEGH